MKYVPLFDGILESTLWDEPLEVRTLYFAMLLLMDADFVVRMDFEKIARKARLRENRREGYNEAEKALKVLMAPDAHTLAEQSQEGIRIQKVEDGYYVVSGEKYQELMYEVNAARKRRKAQQERRAREKGPKPSQPMTGEAAAVAAMGRGDEATADALAAERKPRGAEKGEGISAPGEAEKGVSISATSDEAGKMDTEEGPPVETVSEGTSVPGTTVATSLGPKRLPRGGSPPRVVPGQSRGLSGSAAGHRPVGSPPTSSPKPQGVVQVEKSDGRQSPSGVSETRSNSQASHAAVSVPPTASPAGRLRADNQPARSAGQVLSGMALPRAAGSSTPRPAARPLDPKQLEKMPRTASGMVPGTGEGSMFGGWGERTIAAPPKPGAVRPASTGQLPAPPPRS